MKKLILYFTVASCFLACQPTAQLPTVQQYHLEGFAQGTYYNIRYYDNQNRNLQPQIDSLLDAFNKTASIFDPTSIISRINRNEDVALNEDFIKIFNIAMEVSQHSDGAFDITVGQLVNAWGFGAERRQTMNQATIDSLLTCVGYSKISLKDGKIIKEYPCIKLDFNAIAQGYSVDLVGLFFDDLGIENYLIDIGGEVLAKGNKQGKPWMVGIEQPSDEKGNDRILMTSLPLENMSLVTSGSYRKYFEQDGQRYSHTISPQTGHPVQNTLVSVTVLHPQAVYADAYATVFMVMGLEKSLAFLEKHPELQAFFIYEKDGLQTYATEEFEKLTTIKK